MSENVRIELFIESENIDRVSVASVMGACIRAKSKYNELNGYVGIVYDKKLGVCISSSLSSGTLEEAITAVSKAGGQIFLDHEVVGNYYVAFHRRNYENVREFGRIAIGVDSVRFRYKRSGTERGLQFIQIAKSIWNALDDKSIYGYGDYSIAIQRIIKSHPDDDILAGNVPINKLWLNFYGKKMIEKFGRKKLEEGAYKIEELDDGLLVATDVVPKACKNAGSWEDEEHLEPSEEYLKAHKMKKK